MKALSISLVAFFLILGCGGGSTPEETATTPPSTTATFKFDKSTYAYSVGDRGPASIKFSFCPGTIEFPSIPVRVNLRKETAEGLAPVDFTPNVQEDVQGYFILFYGPNLTTVDVATIQLAEDGSGDLQEGKGQMLATVTFINSSGSPEDESTGADVIVMR